VGWGVSAVHRAGRPCDARVTPKPYHGPMRTTSSTGTGGVT
jgi:hypothetical protein